MQFRHRQIDVGCTVRRCVLVPSYAHHLTSIGTSRGEMKNTVLIDFDEPQNAVALGQVAAVWDGDWCLGSGVIAQTS